MSISKHTPGPWKAAELDELSVKIKVDANYVHECIDVAEVFVMTGNLGEEVPKAVANAKLIASAPELLEALQAMVSLVLKYPDGFAITQRKEIESAQSAIKKATE